MLLITAPHLNANEDEVTFCKFLSKDRSNVEEGDVVAIIESTKAAQDLETPKKGFFYHNPNLSNGDLIKVGSLIGVLTDGEVTDEHLVRIFSKNAPNNNINRVNKKELLLQKINAGKSTSLEKTSQSISTNSKNRVMIIGAKGHATQVIDAVISCGFVPVGCFDNNLTVGTEFYRGVRILGNDDDAKRISSELDVSQAVLGVGALNNVKIRVEIVEKYMKIGFDFPVVVSLNALVSPSAELRKGVVVLQGANIGPNVLIDEFSIINQSANICHDTVIGEHTNIAPGAIIAGSCVIGKRCLIGMGATLFTGITVGDGQIVQNGDNVLNNR